MRTLTLLSPETEAMLALARAVLPLPPSVEARAIARAVAVAESPAPPVLRAVGRTRWVFATAAGAVVAIGAAAFAARSWPPPSSVPDVGDEVAAPPAIAHRTGGVPAPLPRIEAPTETSPPSPVRTRRVATKGTATAVIAMSAELRLLRLARRELTDGNFAGALAATAEHRRRFRNGSLVEEREALRVKSLAGLGRLEEAQRAAVEFHARFPQSVLLSTFEHMTGPER